jgi:TonB-dependent starch-binding outer membrane protein SusC
MIKKNLLAGMLLFFLIPAFHGFSQPEEENPVINLREGTYTLARILDSIVTIPGYHLSYNSNLIPLKAKIIIGNADPTLQQLLRTIENQCPVEIILKDNYIIVRQKPTPKYQVSGRITNIKTGEGIADVTVYVKNSTNAVMSDTTGYYNLALTPGEYTIVFNLMGYMPMETDISVTSDQTVNMEMNLDIVQLDEVQIVAERQFFGNMNQGRTIESIAAKEIEATRTNNVTEVLQARIPGVWVTKVSGAPGDHNEIRIRGINSLFGSVDPLYVIDGVSVPIVNLHSMGIADLNIYDVANITVLKDASSNAIYGFQGGNGVIIIDTKRGGKKEINFSTTIGMQQLPKQYNLMNTEQFFNSMDTARGHGISEIRMYYPEFTDTTCSDDWQDRLFTSGVMNTYQLSAGGTSGKTRYYLSGNYYKHSGIIENTNYTKYTFSASLGRNFFDRLSVEGVYKTSLQQNKNNLDSYWGNRVILEEINKSPAYRCTPWKYYEDTLGHIFVRTYIDYPDLHTREDPDSLIDRTNKYLNIITHTFSGFASLRLSDNLNLNYSTAYSIRNHRYKSQILAYYYYLTYNNYLVSNESYALANNQVNLTYKKSFQAHQFSLVTIGKFYRDMVEWKVDSLLSDFETQTKQENLFTRGNLAMIGESGKAIRHINSYLAHINYAYGNKYFLSLAGNYENLKEGRTRDISKLFPSLALKWDLAKEPVLNRIQQLNHLNLIFNWGQSGNYPLNGLSRDIFSDEHYYFPDTVYHGYTVDQLANHELEPEIVQGYNAGVEVALFKDRLSLQANYYSKTNKNLILQRNIPYYYGAGRIYINIAEMDIHGLEFKLEATPLKTSNWQWFSRLDASTFKQRVNALDGMDKYFYNDDLLIPDFVIKENEPLGNILGYEYLGKIECGTTQDDFENIVFVDGGMYRNVDSIPDKLGEDDKVVIGNILPEYTCNWFNAIHFKNFDLEMLWYAVIGVDKFNSTRASTFISGLNSDINKLVADTNHVITSEAFYQSSYFIEDASFVRLKNISLGYEPGKLLYDKIKLRITIGADNLITLTRYKGFDPEATIYTDNTFSDNAVDLGAYPNPRSYYLSINLTF